MNYYFKNFDKKDFDGKDVEMFVYNQLLFNLSELEFIFLSDFKLIWNRFCIREMTKIDTYRSEIVK